MAVESFQENLAELRSSVEGLNAAKTERISAPSLGDVVRQGDIYLVCLNALPSGKPTKDTQLAPGNTQGSRHILVGDATIVKEVTFRDINSVLTGPAFKCNSDVEVTHPEHGNRILPEGTIWQVVYQLSHSEEVKRVQD